MYYAFVFFLSADGFLVVFIWFLAFWMGICEGGVSPCDGPRSTWSAGAPFLTGNLLVVGSWSGWPLWMTSRECDQCLSVVHICVWKKRPSLAPVTGVKYRTSFAFTLRLSFCFLPVSSLSLSLPLSLSLTLVLSLSHRLALLTGESVVCWAAALSGTGANCKQKTLKGNKKKKKKTVVFAKFQIVLAKCQK